MKNKQIRNRLICLIKGLLSLISIAYNQKSTINYDLKQFKLPYLKRHQLDFTYNLGLNGEKNMSEYISLYSEENEEDKSNRYSMFLNPGYSFYLNTDNIQSDQNLSLNSFSYQKTKFSDDYIDRWDKDRDINIFYDSENRFYFPSKLFIETDLQVDYYQGYSRSETDSIEETTGIIYYHSMDQSNSTRVNARLPILIGYGRIERTEDARLAVYILDDLKKLNKLTREPTEAEITELAQVIAQLKNERFFDVRHKKIWEIEQLDSFLVKTGLVSDIDAAYFTSVKDNWDYASGPKRETGFRISAGVMPGYFYSFHHSNNSYSSSGVSIYDYIFENILKSTSFQGLICSKYELPINLYWQFSIISDIRAGIFKDRYEYGIITNSTGQSDGKIANADLKLQLGYYPNSRTYFNSGLQYYFNFSDEKDKDEDDQTIRRYHKASYFLEGYYYLSPQLRFTLYGNVSYNIRDNDYIYSDASVSNSTYKRWLYQLSLGVTYSFM